MSTTPPNRREILALLGLGGLLASCRGRSAPPALTGSILGAAAARGHALRDAPPSPPSHFEPVPVVIVGAGVAGLSAGWRLLKAGVEEFVTLELEDEPGGNSRAGRSALTAYPWGAHYLPAPPPEATATRQLLTECGVLTGYDAAGRPVFDERARCFAPEERVFYRGEWYSGLYLAAGASDEDRRQWERFEATVARWRYHKGSDGRRAFAIPMERSSRDPELLALDRLTFAQWLDQEGFSSPRLRWVADYACRDDLCAHPHQVSAWVGLHYFCARMLHPDPSVDGEPPTLTWPEGNSFLMEQLARPQRAQLRTGQGVFEVRPEGDHVDVSVLDLATGEVRGLRAQVVIFAAPSFVARRVVAPLRGEGSRTLPSYGAWMVANLHVSERPTGPGAAPAWDNVPYDGAGVGYVCATHQRALYRGPAVLTYYLPLCGEDPARERAHLLAASWEHWVAFLLDDLGPCHPDLRQLTSQIDVWRWGHAFARPAPGFLWGGAREALARPLERVFFAHSDLSLPLFEEANDLGVRAAEAALGLLGERVEAL